LETCLLPVEGALQERVAEGGMPLI